MICQVAKFLQIPYNDEKTSYVMNNLFGVKVRKTLRVGQVDSWKYELNAGRKELFKRIAGQLVVDLAYEDDLSW